MKKLVSLALAVVMAAGMSINAYAATATGFASGKTLANGYAGASGNTVDLGNVYASDKIEREIYLYKDMFVDSSGNALGAANEVLSSSDIRSSKIAVRYTVRGNSKVLAKNPELNSSKGRIDIQFATTWTSTKSEDFEINIYLTIDGKRYEDQSFTLVGTFGNEETGVYSDQDYVDISDGRSIYAEESVSRIEVDIGNGVTILTKLTKGKTYYGQATRNPDNTDDSVMNKYPEIIDVYNLSVVGLNGSGNIVKIDTDFEGYLYDKDLKLLGKTSEMVPLLTKYYFAEKKLDIADDDEPSESSKPDESEPDDEEPSESSTPDDTAGGTGGSGGTGGGGGNTGIGQNPDTGSRGFVGIAVMAAVLSLAAGVVVFRRR